MIIKEFNETLDGLRRKKKYLLKKKERNEIDEKELSRICSYLNSLTIERKRNKKGEYNFYIADCSGKIIDKLIGYYNGKPFDFFWVFSHYKSTDEAELKYDHIVDTGFGGEDSYIKEITEILGGEDKEVQVFINNDGDVIFDGIKEIHQYYFDFDSTDEDENGFLIVSIYPEFHKDLMSKHYNSFFYDQTKTTYCAINLNGEPLIKPTQSKSIFYNSQKKIFFDNMGNKLQ